MKKLLIIIFMLFCYNSYSQTIQIYSSDKDEVTAINNFNDYLSSEHDIDTKLNSKLNSKTEWFYVNHNDTLILSQIRITPLIVDDTVILEVYGRMKSDVISKEETMILKNALFEYVDYVVNSYELKYKIKNE